MAVHAQWQQFKLIALQHYVYGIVQLRNVQINHVIFSHNNLFVIHYKIHWVVLGKIKNVKLSLNVQIIKLMMAFHVLEKVLVKQYLRKILLDYILALIKLIYPCIVLIHVVE